MENIEEVFMKTSRTVGEHEITLNIPVQSIVNRSVAFPDFGIEISNDTPLPQTITEAHLEAERAAGAMVAKEFLDIYPEVLNDVSYDDAVKEIADLYASAWASGKDLDLTAFHGVQPHNK